jgi:hypothetical protein
LFDADVVFFTQRTLVLFFDNQLLFNGDSGLAKELKTDFTQEGGLIAGFWGDFFLADDQSFETIFDHVLSSVVSQFFGNPAPSSSMVDNEFNNDSVFIFLPLTSKNKQESYLFLLGSKWLSHRSRHCFPDLK